MKTRMRLLLVPLVPVTALLVYQPGLVRRSAAPEPASAVGGKAGQWIQGVGYVEPVSEVRRLTFKGNGVIGECRVRVGDLLQAGQILMVLQNEDQRAALEVAEKELHLARAARAKVFRGVNPFQIAAAESRIDLLKEHFQHATREHERSRTMFGSQAVSDAENAQVRTAMLQARAALHQAEAEVLHLKNHVTGEDRQVAEAQVELAVARREWWHRQLEDTILRAPFAGRVLEILKREGEGVRLADNEPVALFGDTSQLRIRAEIEERFARRLKVGQRAQVFGRGLGQECLLGHVVFVKGVMGPKTVFARAATERKDLDVIQVFIEVEEKLVAPVGLEVDVRVALEV
ncbi:MAG: HlyD family efflux transporter periplasmic adaptor subunit [Gemmataceae bacterium]|nr:HlyD family efflux transporter periplasmic adaptor subunit [Gemmataceae bacterium]